MDIAECSLSQIVFAYVSMSTYASKLIFVSMTLKLEMQKMLLNHCVCFIIHTMIKFDIDANFA